MKKRGLSLLLILLMLLLSSCGLGGTNQYETSSAARVDYSSMRYSGSDINPQKFHSEYETYDKEFIAQVEESLRQIILKHTNLKSQSQKGFDILLYQDDKTSLSYSLKPDDFCEINGKFYIMPDGTYKKISKILTDYSAEHFCMVDKSTLEELTAFETLTIFDTRNIYFVIKPDALGDFKTAWNVDSWDEAGDIESLKRFGSFEGVEGYENGGKNRYISIMGSKNLIVSFFTELNIVQIEKDGIIKNYRLSENVMKKSTEYIKDLRPSNSMN